MRPVRQARAARQARQTRPAIRTSQRTSALNRLKAEFERRGIRHVKLAGVDIDGLMRGKYISLDKFWSSAEGGLGFCDVVFGWDIADVLYDNGQVTGWHTGYPDCHARVDLDTFRVIPWEPDTAAFLLDFVNPDGTPYEASPRQLLKRIAEQANELGFSPTFASEFEYFIFKETAESLRSKRFADLTPLSPGMFGYSWTRSSANSPLVKGIVDGCNAFDVEIEGMHTETGPGVYESAIRYDNVVRAADKAVLFKTAVKEICARHEVVPCFMAKQSETLPGCSGHLHQSLWRLDGAKNAFHDDKRPDRMSDTMRHYLGGQIALMPELTALFWPTINSYKRSVENTWAPTTATWGIENRTTAIRVIPGTNKSTRIEYRQPGADMNAYISMAACLAAGLYGIREKIEPPPPGR
ncbi:MAG: glutamine synthetase family protein, partial [Myxococcales bacterium]